MPTYMVWIFLGLLIAQFISYALVVNGYRKQIKGLLDRMGMLRLENGNLQAALRRLTEGAVLKVKVKEARV